MKHKDSSGMELKIAAKVDKVDKSYYDTHIRPVLFRMPRIEFISEIDDAQTQRFLGGACALFHLGECPESFGLAIKAMACGTPVIVLRHPASSTSEIIGPGITGYLVRSIQEVLSAVEKIVCLDRAIVRAHFGDYFTAARMVLKYCDAYGAIRESIEQQFVTRQPHSRQLSA